jgi:hypothetical protein
VLAATPFTDDTASVVTADWLNLDPPPELCPLRSDPQDKQRWIPVHGSYLPEAHNRCFSQALLRDGWDRLLMLENDMILHQHVVARARTHQADITMGLYFSRRYPPLPVLWKAVSPGGRAVNLNHLDVAALLEAPPGEHPIGAGGTGIMSVARHVLELMPFPWFEPSPEALREGHYGGHDLYFCAKAQAQGFSISVDTSPVMLAEHSGRDRIGLMNYLAEMKKREGQQKRAAVATA